MNCRHHPGEPLERPCARCGDFTCATCTRALPEGVAICDGCIERLAGELGSPARLRVVGWEPNASSFPKRCPACASPDATRLVTVWARRGGVVRVGWPFCARCAENARTYRIRRGLTILAIVLVSGLAGFVSAATKRPFLGMSLVGLVVVASLVARVLRLAHFAPDPGVTIPRADRELPSFRRILVLEFTDAQYARLFAALNADKLVR